MTATKAVDKIAASDEQLSGTASERTPSAPPSARRSGDFLPFLRDSAVTAMATVGAGFASYLFTSRAARTLGPADYGSLGALLAIYSLAAISFGPLSGALTTFTADFLGREQPGKAARLLLETLAFTVLAAATIVLATVVVGGRFVAPALRVPGGAPLLLTGLLLISALLFTVTQGALRGQRRFIFVGGATIGEATVRLLLGVALLQAGFGLSGALGGYLLGSFFAFTVTLWGLRRLLRQPRAPFERHPILRFAGRLFVVTLVQAALISTPTLLAKRLLSPAEAGYFVAAVALGNLVVPIAQALSVTVYPEIVARRARGESDLPLLWRVLFLSGGVSLSAVLAFALLGDFVVRVTFGASFAAVAPQLWKYALATGLATIGGAYMSFAMARQRFHFTPALIGALAIQTALLWLFHRDLGQFITALVVSAAVSSVLVAGTAAWDRR